MTEEILETASTSREAKSQLERARSDEGVGIPEILKDLALCLLIATDDLEREPSSEHRMWVYEIEHATEWLRDGNFDHDTDVDALRKIFNRYSDSLQRAGWFYSCQRLDQACRNLEH